MPGRRVAALWRVLGGLALLLAGAGLAVTGRRGEDRRGRLPAQAHERTDASSAAVLGGGLAIVAGLALSVVLASWYYAALTGRPPALRPPAAGLQDPPPATAPRPPALRAQLRALREAEQRLLSTYAWVDRERGIVRIPIERAIEILLADPPPARPGAAPITERVAADSASGRFVERRMR